MKTLVAFSLRAQKQEDVAYLGEVKSTIPILPERLPEQYRVARRLFDRTVGTMLRIGTSYYGDDWPASYASTPRSMSDEGFLYLCDIALHIPPFEFTTDLIRRGRARWEDFVPANRYVRAIDAILKAGRFPPPEHPQAPGQYYRIVFDSVARSLCWPLYDETNAMWLAKLQKYKELRKEATDGYRYRLTAERNKNPSAIVVADCVEACMRQFVPILHLTPTGLKSLGGYIIGESRYFTPFEVPGFSPFAAMTRDLPLWQDFPSLGTLDDLHTESDNQMLFRQEVAYRIVSSELKNAILYRDRFVCPFAKCGCDVAMPECGSQYSLDNLPASGCCVRFYAEAKQIDISRFRWVAE